MKWRTAGAEEGAVKLVFAVKKVVLLGVFIIFASVLSCTQANAKPGYLTMIIKDLVRIDIPEEWTVSSFDRRKNIKEFADNLTSDHEGNIPALSAKAAKGYWFLVRVKVDDLAGNERVSQDVLNDGIRTYGESSVLDSLLGTKEELATEIKNSLLKIGLNLVDNKVTTSVTSFDGKTALKVSYRRMQPNPDYVDRVITVEQYHVYLGDKFLLLTLSYGEKAPDWREIKDAIFGSIQINSKG